MSLSIPNSNTRTVQSSKIELIEKKSDMILASITAKSKLQEELDIVDKKCQKIFSEKKSDCESLIHKNNNLENINSSLKRQIEYLKTENKLLSEDLKNYTNVNNLSKKSLDEQKTIYYKRQERLEDTGRLLTENMALADQKIKALEEALLVRNTKKKWPGLI